MRVPSETLSVSVEESNDSLQVLLFGWLDATSVPALDRAVANAGSRDVVLHIEGLTFVDGNGWLGVIGCEQRLANRGGRLRIEDGVRKILELETTASRWPSW